MAKPHQPSSAGTEVPIQHAQPTALGLTPAGWVALAMIAVFAILVWKRVPAAIGKALDAKIAGIRERLAEAAALREEAEALRKEYEAKAASADADAAAMIERAKVEAEAIIAKANADAKALIERRARMAEDKIAAEERAAINQLRATAATAATRAAEKLIAERLDSAADSKLVDQAINDLGKSS